MNSASRRNPRSERQSIFFHDLASPVSVHRTGGRFTTPGQTGALSALWHESFGGSELPPPPAFTLEDRVDFSPEPTLGELPASPELGSDSRTSKLSRGYVSSPQHKSWAETSSSVLNVGLQGLKEHQSPGSANWWSPVKNGETDQEEKGRGSPVDGVVKPGALIMLPPPSEAVRPEMKRNNLPIGALDEEEWVTVYGFTPGDTNLVLREFEKCGSILKHVPGPRDANWMHILYQNRHDAQRALEKSGAQINNVVIVGVKPVDPTQRQYLEERLGWSGSHQSGFSIPSFSPRAACGGRRSSGAPLAPLSSAHHSAAAIASPAKSVMSKVMDLMFGI